jgi:hypothetical protein
MLVVRRIGKCDFHTVFDSGCASTLSSSLKEETAYQRNCARQACLTPARIDVDSRKTYVKSL